MLDTTTLELDLPTRLADALAETHKNGLSHAVIAGLKFWLAFDADTRQLLSDMASVQGISKGELTAKAVRYYYENSGQAGTLPIEVVPRLSRAHREQRNARIMELVGRGMTRAAIATEVGLSAIRVNQIVAEHRAKNAEPKA